MNNPSDTVALNSEADRTLSFRRRYEAPIELIREVYRDPTHLDRWWGPEGFSITTHEMDFRTGGHWAFTMHGSDGTDYPNYIRYTEMSEFKMSWDHGVDEKADWFKGSVQFEVDGAATILTMSILFPTLEAMQESINKHGAREGMHGTQCRLAALLGDLQGKPIGLQVTTPDDLSIRMVRRFDAPRAMVYEALANPEQLKQWWGPHGYVNDVMESEQRVGGKWRAVQRNPEGETFAFHGEILALDPPNGMSQTFIFDPMPECICTESVQLIEDHGKTIMVAHMTFNSRAERDGMLESGMEWGASQSYERLDAFLAERTS
ncbi:MAG: SRPBCC domain-containing protein [Fimbriimonadaceae bacterium]|nr:SRPBCC domain-containing protein [Fimbriimonadaceae bacterium]